MVPSGGRMPTEAELQQFFLPYRGFCARRGIAAKEIILPDIDVPSALLDYVVNNSISNIVVGASSRNALTRKFKTPDVPSSLVKSAPPTCSVYVISKDKLQTVKAATKRHIFPSTPSCIKDNPKKSYPIGNQPNIQPKTPDSFDMNRSTYSIGSLRSQSSDSTSSEKSTDVRQMNFDSWRENRSPLVRPLEAYVMENLSIQSSSSDATDFSGQLSYPSSSDNVQGYPVPENSMGSFSSHASRGLEAEIEKLKLEFKQSLSTYNMACEEVSAAEEKAKELQRMKTAEVIKFTEPKLRKEVAWTSPTVEKQETSVAKEVTQIRERQQLVEAKKGHNAEDTTNGESGKRKRAINALAQKNVWYRKYTIEEIEEATDYFSNSLKIGEGGYGPVFKACLDHTPVAIKVLRPDVSQGLQQFQQEVEVLSCMRHPNMVLLVGACPEYGCLVYEYMDNGSLEDRIFCKNNTPPISWRSRFKIAAEIATGLLFLHQTKPEPLVHRDIKPSNILLDHHYVSKISDVGLARLVPPSIANKVTEYHMTAAAGTFCYIDPEYQQTGMLGVKSDVYSFGVMLLQIITARPPMGLAMQVEDAIEGGTFPQVLDPAINDWPVEEALSLAKMALRCCELRRRDRPDLGSEVLPELNRLKDFGLDDEATIEKTLLYNPRPYSSVPEMESKAPQEGKNNPNVAIQLRSM
ncbi:U-box domain-containing protein 52-like isoform X2 [Syzygium oleosum]|uniref:U-box domain-containing protein 52-like isoform X2 n=1 Tax=Syzygium oleosum TaxID=219896 RepID=UPI0024B923B4|nr:U-box domain-containing protein 52-like isoform X2 [Syzygium oleosum]